MVTQVAPDDAPVPGENGNGTGLVRKAKAATRGAVLPTALTTTQVRPVVYRVLSKKNGLNVKSTALSVLTEFLGRHFGTEWRGARAEAFLDEIARQWKEQDRGLFVEGDGLKTVIRDLVNAEAQSERDENAEKDGESNGEPARAVSIRSATASMRESARLRAFQWRDYFRVLGSNEQLRVRYSGVNKRMELVPGRPSVVGNASALVSLFATRYHAARDRLLRNERFTAPSFRAAVSGNTYSITDIKNMLGRNGKKFLLFGLLSIGADGEFWLQDASGRVQLDLSAHANAAPGVYYTPGSLVLCDGAYADHKFVVGTVGPPPAERREATRAALGFVDYLGLLGTPPGGGAGGNGGSGRLERLDSALERHMEASERELSSHRIVVLGCDIYLDQLRTIDALRKLFTRLEADADASDSGELPVAIVLPGPFFSIPFQPNGSSAAYKEGFDFFAQLLGDFPRIASHCTLVFVPGDNDPWAATFSGGATPVWPLSPVPSLFTSRVSRVAPRSVSTSNPSRLAYLLQEIVMVRDDYGDRFRRNCVNFDELHASEAAGSAETTSQQMEIDATTGPETTADSGDHHPEADNTIDDDASDDEDVVAQQRLLQKLRLDNTAAVRQSATPQVAPDVAESRRIARTLLDQGHLSPFPLTKRPVQWDYDHVLSLSPLPSVLILADPTTPQFKVTYEGCHVINPGPFMTGSKINWMEYHPSTRTTEIRSIYL